MLLGILSDIQVDTATMWAAAGFLGLGALGAAVAAALLVYSPSKMLKRLTNGHRAIVEDLQTHDFAYQVLARCMGLVGVSGTAICVARSTAFLPWWALWGCAALLLYGVLPAMIAARRAESVLLRTHGLFRVLRVALYYPVVVPIRAVVGPVLRLMKITREGPSADREEIAEEILAAVDDSAAENALEVTEREWLGNIVELKDISVAEAMTPRTDMVAIDETTPLRDAIAIALSSGHSRYPVYRDRVDDVVGVFYAKDALRLGQPESTEDSGETAATIGPETPISEMLRKPLFVPHNMGVIELLEQFKGSKVQLAVVSDEYGGTAGLITIEDIIEEIVGDIHDEYDAEDADALEVIEEGRVLELSARERVEEVNLRLGTDLPEDGDFDTIAGFVFAELGRIPSVGESFHCHGVEFRILTGDERRLGRLRVVALQPHEHGGS